MSNCHRHNKIYIVLICYSHLEQNLMKICVCVRMENSRNVKILEQGLKKVLIFSLMLILFFIIGMSLFSLRQFITSIMS